jgi:hypothetical protein
LKNKEEAWNTASTVSGNVYFSKAKAWILPVFTALSIAKKVKISFAGGIPQSSICWWCS